MISSTTYISCIREVAFGGRAIPRWGLAVSRAFGDLILKEYLSNYIYIYIYIYTHIIYTLYYSILYDILPWS